MSFFLKKKRANCKHSNIFLVDKGGGGGRGRHGNAILGFQVIYVQRKYSDNMQLNFSSLYSTLFSSLFILFQPTITKAMHSCLPILWNCNKFLLTAQF